MRVQAIVQLLLTKCKKLIRQTHQNDHGTCRCKLGMPHVVTRLQYGGQRSNLSPFGMGLRIRSGGDGKGDQCNGNGYGETMRKAHEGTGC